MQPRYCLALILLIGSIPTIAFAATLEVPNQYATIQQAINAAAPGDTVLVGAGTYYEYIDFIGKPIAVKSRAGYAGTVIDAGEAWCVASFVNGEGPDSVLDGFTLTNGLGGGSPHYIGGGVTCKYSSPTITNNRIANNFSGSISQPFGDGGAIYCSHASPLISNNIIIYNEATYNCGGIYLRDESAPTITNNIINWNIGYVSGAIYCQYSSSPLIENNLIHENIATNGCEGWGAGIFCYFNSNPTIRYNTITNNLGYKPGAGICCRAESAPLIEYNLIKGNHSTRSAGGIMVESSDPIIRSNCIAENSSVKYGGAMWIDMGSPEITNNFILNNLCNGEFGGYGAGIYIGNYSAPILTNNTFYGNWGNASGGGIYCVDIGAMPAVANNIFWGNYASQGSEIYLAGTTILTISHCDVMGGQAGVAVEAGSTLNWGAGMIDIPPQFVNALEDDYHLRYASPCRDGGRSDALALPSMDFEGDPRAAYGLVDIGADEFHPHFYCSGDATPGGEIVARFIGIPGASPVGVWFGSGIFDPPKSTPYGNWYLAPPRVGPFILIPIPSSSVLELTTDIPHHPAGPYQLLMQAIIGDCLTNYTILNVE